MCCGDHHGRAHGWEEAKMVSRRISKEKYVLAAIITFLIFFSGLSLGIILDNARLKDLQFTARKQEADYNSLQFTYFFISNIDEDGRNCNVLRTALDKTTAELGESLYFINAYEKRKKFFDTIKHVDREVE